MARGSCSRAAGSSSFNRKTRNRAVTAPFDSGGGRGYAYQCGMVDVSQT